MIAGGTFQFWAWSRRPPNSQEMPDNSKRHHWWLSRPTDLLPRDPPSVIDEPSEVVRLVWWRRVNLEFLPEEPPTCHTEPYDVCRFTWWQRTAPHPPAYPTLDVDDIDMYM